MRMVSFVLLMLVAILMVFLWLNAAILGKSAIHEILAGVYLLTAVVSLGLAVIIRSLSDPPR